MQIPYILTNTPAIRAVLVTALHNGAVNYDSVPVFHGDEKLRAACADASALIRHVTADAVRVSLGAITIVVQDEGDRLFTVAVSAGDPIKKSLHRMIRQAGRVAAAGDASARLRPTAEHVSDLTDSVSGDTDAA